MLRSLLFAFAVLMWMPGRVPNVALAERNAQATLELVNKGYVNLLIGINERVPEDPALLDRIKFVFTEASKFLYRATRQRAYFKGVHILVPESWSNSAYPNVEWQRYDQSDVIVDLPSDNGGNRPYTNKPTPCGEPGLFIHLTPDYILAQSIAGRYGDYDKTLVHEWAHYRWGVFDEYPLENGQHFYAANSGAIEAVRCVLGITGRMVNPRMGFRECEIDENGIPERDCRFLDNADTSGYTGSLMYKQYLPRVMLEHKDFKTASKGENAANGGEQTDGQDDGDEDDVEPVPEFTVVKKQSSRLVLVLDRSGSMKGQRLRQLRQASELLINSILVDGEELGIVQFNDEGEIKSDLLPINADNREVLLNKLPTFADGATSIGSGISVGLQVLENNSWRRGSPAGGKILVITDGEENIAPYIEDILHLVNGSGVTIDTIAIGPDAAPSLELLSSITGGSAYYHDENSNSLSDAFSKSSTTEKAITTTAITLYTDFIQLQPGTKFTGAVFVDSTLGRNTQFLFGHGFQDGISVNITDPDGNVISQGSPGYENNIVFRQIRVTIPDLTKMGLWMFEVVNTHSSQENVTILVQSHSRGDGDPIVVNAQWGLDSVVPPQKQFLIVSVGKGNIPVINSDVTAVVDLPCGNATVTLRPKDGGIGADVRKDDGVYSTYFTEFCGEGRYGVTINVSSKGEVTSIALGSIIGAGAIADPTYEGVDGESLPELTTRSTGYFQRVARGGSFKCEGSELCNGTIDRYPPARITDLRASNVDIDKMQITLNFTAVGDDLMTGKASRYIIVVSQNSTELFDNYEAAKEIPKDRYVTGDVNITRNAGETEVFVIHVLEVGKFSYFFSVVAVDDDDNRGEPSNVAASSARDFRKFPFALVIGLSAGGALLIIVLIALTVLLCKKRKPKEKITREIPESNMNHYSEPGMEGGNPRDPLYDNVITRRDKDPNWDPTLPNNREGGGAHIKPGHVSMAVSVFDNKGFSE